MSSESIKIEIIEWLTRLEDKGLLSTLLQFKKVSEKSDWSDDLSEEQVASLNRGLQDLQDNKLITSKDFWNSYGK